MTEPTRAGDSQHTAPSAGPAGAADPASPAATAARHAGNGDGAAGATATPGPDAGQGASGTAAPQPGATGAIWPYLLLALIVIVLDQISKYAVIERFVYAERLPVVAGFFDLTLLYNPGAAFSFLAGHGGWQRWFFTAIAVVASGVMISLLRSQRGQVLFSTALGLILGGAIGNLIDRLVLGHVTDFLLFYWGSWSFPAFNLADCAITLGAILLILSEVLPWMRRGRS